MGAELNFGVLSFSVCLFLETLSPLSDYFSMTFLPCFSLHWPPLLEKCCALMVELVYLSKFYRGKELELLLLGFECTPEVLKSAMPLVPSQQIFCFYCFSQSFLSI